MSDYIGKYVKQFESGSQGSLALSQCGYDWGLSCGSYQLTLRWGNCINFLHYYFPEESSALFFKTGYDTPRQDWPGYGYCSSPDDVKEVWLQCYNKYGEFYFFSCEHEYIKRNCYDVIKNKIKDFIDLDKTSRAFQECFWSWSVHRGNTGAYNAFLNVVQQITDWSDFEKLFDTIYDIRYQNSPTNRYSYTSSSEREILRPLLYTLGIGVNQITSPANVNKGETKMKYNNTNRPLVCMMTTSTCYQQTTRMEVKGVLWHSTGANNPTIKRYVQPSDDDPNRAELLNTIGINIYGNDWNHIYHRAGLNCWIGELADGTVSTVQTMPWDYKPWGCGSGSKGSCNNGWIQFEICEDSLNDAEYFQKVYEEACQLTAYLCSMYGIDPNGTVLYNGIQVPTILCHADSNKLGLGSNHGDINHWFPKFGKSMETARADVAAIMAGNNEIIFNDEDDEDMTQDKFNEMMQNYLNNLADKPADWDASAMNWAVSNGLLEGDEHGRLMPKKFMTRGEFMTVLQRYDNKK